MPSHQTQTTQERVWPSPSWFSVAAIDPNIAYCWKLAADHTLYSWATSLTLNEDSKWLISAYITWILIRPTLQ